MKVVSGGQEIGKQRSESCEAIPTQVFHTFAASEVLLSSLCAAIRSQRFLRRACSLSSSRGESRSDFGVSLPLLVESATKQRTGKRACWPEPIISCVVESHREINAGPATVRRKTSCDSSPGERSCSRFGLLRQLPKPVSSMASLFSPTLSVNRGSAETCQPRAAVRDAPPTTWAAPRGCVNGIPPASRAMASDRWSCPNAVF